VTARHLHRYVLPLAVVVGALAYTADVDGAASRTGFPCGGSYDLAAGAPEGHVRATASADCRGEQGAITVVVRVLERATGPWRVGRSRTKTWHDLARLHTLSVTLRCPTGTVRGVFSWVLHAPSGAFAGARKVRTKPIAVNTRCDLKSAH
jgi:hypothetical protein